MWRGTAKLVEEMGELQVNLGKLMSNHGRTWYIWEKRDLLPEIEDEVADVLACLVFFMKENSLDVKRILERTQMKLVKYNEWKINNE